MAEGLETATAAQPKKKRRWLMWILLAVVGLPVLLLAVIAMDVNRRRANMSPQELAAADARVSALNAQDRAKAVVTGLLKDPESAEFRNVFSPKRNGVDDANVVCGEVNSKNSFGAKTGFIRFVSATTGADAAFGIQPAVGSKREMAEFEAKWDRHCHDK